MSSQSEATQDSQARAQEAAKADTEPSSQGDVHASTQEVSSEHSAGSAHERGMRKVGKAEGSESKDASGDKVDEAKDKVLAIGSSSS